MRWVRLLVVALPVAGVTSLLACGSNGVGVESCRRIEQARCENAPSCGIDLTQPTHRGDTPELAVAACTRFYQDACLHGFVAPVDPGAVQVQACIDAINTGDCTVVKTPESSPACGFLVPPPAAAATPADASTDGF